MTPAFSGVPRKGDKIRNGYITLPLQSSFMMRDGKKGKNSSTPFAQWHIIDNPGI